MASNTTHTCDKCGEKIDWKSLSIMTLLRNVPTVKFPYGAIPERRELCDECVDEVKGLWFNGE